MKPFHLMLALMMLITGSVNTIVTKYADLFCSTGLPMRDNCTNAAADKQHCIMVPSAFNGTLDYATAHGGDAAYCAKSTHIKEFKGDKDAKDDELLKFRLFNHPFVQAFTMFVGEFMCLVVYKLLMLFGSKKTEKPKEEGPPPPDWPVWIWAGPALCDSCATTSMYIGLTLTDASSFQMLRGSVVIFTGFLSMFWLKKKLVSYNWAGMVLVLVGLIFVGLAGFFGPGGGAGAKNPILGDCIIIAAQVIVAVQMVLEEKLMTKYKVPVLCAVGWEGIFGMIYMIGFSFLFTYLGGKDPQENLYDALLMLSHSVPLLLTFFGTICSIAFFNFSGLSVTKEMSATTRMVLDSVRTVVIWIVCVLAPKPYGGTPLQTINEYTVFQVVGFVVLLSGTFVYNEKEVGSGMLNSDGTPMMESLASPLLRAVGIMKRRPVYGGSINERSGLLAPSGNIYE